MRRTNFRFLVCGAAAATFRPDCEDIPALRVAAVAGDFEATFVNKAFSDAYAIRSNTPNTQFGVRNDANVRR